jgi:hypothetical protein
MSWDDFLQCQSKQLALDLEELNIAMYGDPDGSKQAWIDRERVKLAETCPGLKHPSRSGVDSLFSKWSL